jgi:hypothetical protein
LSEPADAGIVSRLTLPELPLFVAVFVGAPPKDAISLKPVFFMFKFSVVDSEFQGVALPASENSLDVLPVGAISTIIWHHMGQVSRNLFVMLVRRLSTSESRLE